MSWTRRSFHECAEELRQISEQFREAYLSSDQGRVRSMQDASTRGVDVLKILVMSVRPEIEHGMIANPQDAVGTVIENVSPELVDSFVSSYRPTHANLTHSRPLTLREALNKIAHASPLGNGFFADRDTHDLLLNGEYNRRKWIAVVSIVKVCDLILKLPDQPTVSHS